MKNLKLTTVACLACALAPGAFAQRGQPASLLFVPEVDSRPGIRTFLTVTNTHPTDSVIAEYVYYDQDLCEEFNRSDILEFNDTLTVLADVHSPTHEQGFAYVFARNDSFEAIDFDWLIGTSTIVNGLDSFAYTTEPFTFEALTGEGLPTDLDGDGLKDLDGVEYGMVADELLFPRFLGQPGPTGQTSDLILINLTGTVEFDATADLIIWNDDSDFFSVQYAFNCWTRVPLGDVAIFFDNAFLQGTGHDPNEILGLPGWESGWFSIDGNVAVSPMEQVDDPAILAALVGNGPMHAFSELPFGRGTQANGALIVNSIVIPFTTGESAGADGLSRRP